MFPFTYAEKYPADIDSIKSRHVECVVLMTNVKNG
jgi:hypothetical protein